MDDPTNMERNSESLSEQSDSRITDPRVIGVRVTLEALLDIATRSEAELKHEPSGVKITLCTADERLAIIGGALDHVVTYLRRECSS